MAGKVMVKILAAGTLLCHLFSPITYDYGKTSTRWDYFRHISLHYMKNKRHWTVWVQSICMYQSVGPFTHSDSSSSLCFHLCFHDCVLHLVNKATLLALPLLSIISSSIGCLDFTIWVENANWVYVLHHPIHNQPHSHSANKIWPQWTQTGPPTRELRVAGHRRVHWPPAHQPIGKARQIHHRANGKIQ